MLIHECGARSRKEERMRRLASPARNARFAAMMQVLALLVAGFAVALVVGAVQARRNIRSCCGRDAACDLRMRDAA